MCPLQTVQDDYVLHSERPIADGYAQSTYHKFRCLLATVVLPVCLRPEQAWFQARRARRTNTWCEGDHVAEPVHHVGDKVLCVVRQYDLMLPEMLENMTPLQSALNRVSDLCTLRQHVLFALEPCTLKHVRLQAWRSAGISATVDILPAFVLFFGNFRTDRIRTGHMSVDPCGSSSKLRRMSTLSSNVEYLVSYKHLNHSHIIWFVYGHKLHATVIRTFHTHVVTGSAGAV